MIDIINQLTLNERDHPEQSEWASNDKLKVLRAKTEFLGEKGTLPKTYRNLACVFNLLTCPKDSRFKATTSTPACWPTKSVSDLPASRNCMKQLLKINKLYIYKYTHTHTYICTVSIDSICLENPD